MTDETKIANVFISGSEQSGGGRLMGRSTPCDRNGVAVNYDDVIALRLRVRGWTMLDTVSDTGELRGRTLVLETWEGISIACDADDGYGPFNVVSEVPKVPK